MSSDEIKVCFVIAFKYFRGYNSHILEYINNINSFYKNAHILIVDNNSTYLQDFNFNIYENVTLLINESECKFELGAYKVGIKYILDNNLTNDYEYYIFTQDTFIIHNKYDFSILLNNNTFACPLVGSRPGTFSHEMRMDDMYYKHTINQMGIDDENIPNLTFCLATSFVLYKNKLYDFLKMTENIIIYNKHGSCASERFLSGALYLLNNKINAKLEDIFYNDIHPSSHVIYYANMKIPNHIFKLNYFTKFVYNKHETCIDIL